MKNQGYNEELQTAAVTLLKCAGSLPMELRDRDVRVTGLGTDGDFVATFCGFIEVPAAWHAVVRRPGTTALLSVHPSRLRKATWGLVPRTGGWVRMDGAEGPEVTYNANEATQYDSEETAAGASLDLPNHCALYWEWGGCVATSWLPEPVV